MATSEHAAALCVPFPALNDSHIPEVRVTTRSHGQREDEKVSCTTPRIRAETKNLITIFRLIAAFPVRDHAYLQTRNFLGSIGRPQGTL